MDSLAILVAAESLVNLCGKVNAYIQWLTSKFSDRDRQNLLQVLRFEIGSLAYVFEAISVHLGDDETSVNPFKSFEDTHLQRLLEAMNECRLGLTDLTGMLQPNSIQPQGSMQQRARSPSVGGGVNWELLPILKKKFGLYRKGMGLSLRTVELSAHFGSKPHNPALRSDVDRLGSEAGELLHYLREQVFVDASLTELANCVKATLDIVYAMQRLATPTTSPVTSPEMTEIEPGPFRSQPRPAYGRAEIVPPLVKKSSRTFLPAKEAPPVPDQSRNRAYSFGPSGNGYNRPPPTRTQTYDSSMSQAGAPEPQPIEYHMGPSRSPPIPRPQRSQTFERIRSPEPINPDYRIAQNVSPAIPRPPRSQTYDAISPLSRSPEPAPMQYSINVSAISPPPPTRPPRPSRSQTLQEWPTPPTFPVPRQDFPDSNRGMGDLKRDYKDALRDYKLQTKRSQTLQPMNPPQVVHESKPTNQPISPALSGMSPGTPGSNASDPPPPWSPPPPLSLDNIPENASSISGASGLGIEDYMIDFLNKNLALPDSGASSPRLDVQSPQFMQQRPAPPVMRQLPTPALSLRMPSPPPTPRVQSPILSASPVPTTQSTTSDTEFIQQWRLSGSRNFATGDYGRAQMLLEQVIKGSEMMFGDDYAWRAETKSLLAETCIRLGRWDDAGKIFTEKYDGREAQIDSVANGFLRERQWDKLTWVLQQKFSGRETIMEAASRALILDQKWAEAKEMLVGLMTYKKEDCARGLERMYLLAEVCWSRKDLGDAKQMCITAIESQNSILQRSDPLYSQFVKLAIQICDAQNEREQAEKFRSLLSFGVAECAEIDKLSTMRPKDAATEIDKGRALKDVKLGTNKQKKSIKENILKSGKGILGTGRGWALVHALASNGRESAVELLLRKGIDVDARDEEGNTSLNVAAAHGQVATAKILLDYHASPSIKNKMGYSPLMTATIKGSQNAIRMMLDEGGDVETRDTGQNTLLMSAVMDQMPDVVKMLLKRGANLESKNQAGRTSLMIAALIGDAAMSKLLLKKGSEINAKDNDGNTPLMLAANKEHEPVVELLLRRGADIMTTNNNGHNALYIAKKSAIYRTPVVRKLLAMQQAINKQTAGSTDGVSVLERRPSTIASGLSRSISTRSSSSYATSSTESARAPTIDSIHLPRVPETAVY